MSDHLPDAGKMVDLDRLQQLSDAATPGPWEYCRHSTIYAMRGDGRPILVIDATAPNVDEEPQWHGSDANLDILLEARNALPALLAEVRALRGKLDEREGDMHLRIRAGYDKTVADSWRREVARVEKERDDLRAEREKTEAALRRLSKWAAIWDHIRPSTGAASQVRELGLWREPKETTNG